ncbi:7-alpha-hydroxycholest-4-en-3-one 12-alpha-hydroxylase [Fusarium austroafricanum]|uniref:7-alpha-hydroxycholest-4-en-3-one 12-alpha-hydroxylase n=1 Tax=Fusarium austroafricanum TaxID=2364996 RepID=A0A8H4K309_9HYPO|nr:7-alpha-hydroxycholest-4-en-3-one 12-alpha-hydroxylase [Fusarium austroafricanum]
MNATVAAPANLGSATDAASYLMLLALFVLPFLVTYVITSRGNRGYQNGNGVREPPSVPYWIPYVGNTIGFAHDTERFLFSILSKFGQVPLSIFVGGEPMYFIPHGKPIIDLFAARQVTTKSLGVMTVRDAFGLPEEDLAIYLADDSGFDAKPAPGWEDVDPLKRFHFVQHCDMHTYLTGNALKTMSTKFTEVYTKNIEKDTMFREDEWTEIDDLWGWLRNNVLSAAIVAMCGEKFLELSPNFLEEFWTFDTHLPKLLKRMPRWLVPKSYAARDVYRETMIRWHEYGNQHLDFDDEEVLKKDWTPEFGARLMSSRQKLFKNNGFSVRGGAALDSGLIWAFSGNSIPAAFWMLFDTLLDKNLTERVIAEMEPCFHERSLSFDADKLYEGPLINAIYLETLRLRVAAPIGRTSLIPNLKFGRWKLKQGVTMLSSSWVGGHDRDFWNVGHVQCDGSPEHPVETFWAERFLIYEDDPTSGPVRKNVSKNVKRTSEDDRKARADVDGTQGYYYPYGGGKKMCPGRFFAKHELMDAVLIALRAYEIELVNIEAAKKIGPNMDYFPFGTIPPKGKVLVKVKACSVNPIDHKVRSGTYDDAPDYYKYVPKDFHIIGYDGAGVIAKAGPDCQLFKVGDEVSWVGATTEQGSYAEYQLLSEFSCAHKPKNFDFVDAASYGLTFVTAYQSLFRRLEIKSEEKTGILIINGGGGVGSAAIQIARKVLKLPVVVATASRQETISSCKKMGATHVINHREDLVQQIENLKLNIPIKYVYIVARTEQYTRAVAKICAPFGKVCTIVQADVSLYGTDFMSKSLTFSWDWLGSAAYHHNGVEDYHEMLEKISRLMEDGTLVSTVGIRLRLTLEGLKEAHRRVESSTTVGKIALGVDEPGEGAPFA